MTSRLARQQDSRVKSEKTEYSFQQIIAPSCSPNQRIVASPASPTFSLNKLHQKQHKDQFYGNTAYQSILEQLSTFMSHGEFDDSNFCGEARRIGTAFEQSLKDAYRLIWEASSTLADTRPPPNFCIYNKSGSTIPPQNNSNSNNVQPPIFDGSVANATPATHGNFGASGGAGTILHLACAMDRPLMLAFLLAMGADGRSTHTVFRRLMVHEASCNGSINCLTLLLEAGRKFMKDNKAGKTKDWEIKINDAAVVSNAPINFIPFLPDAMKILPSSSSQFLYPLPRLSPRSVPQVHANVRHFGPATASTTKTYNSERYTDFVSLIRQFRNYSMLVTESKISELQAARSFLTKAPDRKSVV